MRPRPAPLLVVLALLVGCESASEEPINPPPREQPSQEVQATDEAAQGDVQRHPDVLEAELTRDGDAYDIAVTISSPYDTADRYADGWRVLGPDDEVLGEHQLMHDHAGEQPFTRTQQDVVIPADVDEVTIEGRDQRYGYGGDVATVDVPGR